jgi:hypothetical protein
MMHVQRPAQVDVDPRVPLRGIGVDEVLETVPAGVVDENIHRVPRERGLGCVVICDAEDQRFAAHLLRDTLRALGILVGHQYLHLSAKRRQMAAPMAPPPPVTRTVFTWAACR